MTFTDLAQGIIVNLFLLLGFVSLFSMIRGWLATRVTIIPPWVDGFLFGGMAIVAMSVPSVTGPGVIFDCRSGIIGAGALLGGPWCALSSIPLPFLYRVHIGGAGLSPGLMEIILPAVLGSLCHWFYHLRHRSFTLRDSAIYSLIVGAFSSILIVGFILIVMPSQELLLGAGSRMIGVLIGPVSMALFTVLLVLEKQHFETDVALSRSEKKYRQLIETTETGYVIIDKNGCVVDANQVYVRLTGRQRLEDVVGHSVLEWTAPHDQERNALEVQQCVNQGKVRGFVIDYVSPAGQITPIEINATLLSGADNLLILSLCRDISDRKAAEESLKTSQDLYRAVVENANDAIIIIQDGFIVFNNKRAETLTGYTKEESAETPFSNFVVPDDRDALVDGYFKRLNGEKFRTPFAFRIMHKNGNEIWAEINTAVVSWEGKPALQCFIRDITLRRKMEFQLNQAQKMESIGILAGGIAHDFNNLLMAIQGRLSLLMFEMAKDGGFSHYQKKITEIEKDLVRAADLTSKLLGFARKGKIEVRPTDVNNLVSQQAQMFGRTKKEITIHEDLSTDQLVAELDRRQIEQVLLNIYINAAQAMPNGGDLFVRTEIVTLSEKDTMQHEALPGVYIKISVTDTGVGMDEKVQARLFEPFFTTKEMGSGTGLGLASAFGIIKNHNGFITFYSEKNKGTSFYIFLPASKKAPVKETVPDDEIIMGNGNVLLVDDEAMVAEVGSEILQTLGYKVRVARSGPEALEIYQANRNEIDLIILDLIMPGMSGDEMFDRFKQINPEVKVLLSSGYSIDGQASAIIARGCDGFIQKPYKMSVLSRKISEVLGIAGK